MEKIKYEKKSKAGIPIADNGRIVAQAVKKLQENRSEEEFMSFEEIYIEVNKVKTLSKDTIARKLAQWNGNKYMNEIRGELWVYDKKKNLLEISDTIKRKGEEKERKGIGEKRYQTAYFKLKKTMTKLKETPEKNIIINENNKQNKEKNRKKEPKKRVKYLKSDVGDYSDIILWELKKHKGYIGNGNEICKKVNEYLKQYVEIDLDEISDVDVKTILRSVWRMLENKNMKQNDQSGIRIGIENGGQEKALQEGFKVARFNPDVVSDDPLPFEYEFKEDSNDNWKYIKKMNLQVFELSKVWGNLEEDWDGEQALSYLDFIVNISRHGEQWAISYEILKILFDNQAKREGMSQDDIAEKLQESIPMSYIARKAFKKELEEAFVFIRKNELAQMIDKRWVLGKII